MAAYTRTDFVDPRLAALSIVVSHQGARTTIALDGEWDLAQQKGRVTPFTAPSRANRTEWCLISVA